MAVGDKPELVPVGRTELEVAVGEQIGTDPGQVIGDRSCCQRANRNWFRLDDRSRKLRQGSQPELVPVRSSEPGVLAKKPTGTSSG